jgi:hypothetical protein
MAIHKERVRVGKATKGDLKGHYGAITGCANTTGIEWKGLQITVKAEPADSVSGTGPTIKVTTLDEHGKVTPASAAWSITGSSWSDGESQVDLPDVTPGISMPVDTTISITVDLGTGATTTTHLDVTVEGTDATGLPIT